MKNLFLLVAAVFTAAAVASSCGGGDGQQQTAAKAKSATDTTEQQATSGQLSPERTLEMAVDTVDVTLVYSAPSVRGREIFGELVPFEELWRTGANACSNFRTTGPITVNGEQLSAGSYCLFTVPGEAEWEVIFNDNDKSWGTEDYEERKSKLTLTVPVEQVGELTEQMTFSADSSQLCFDWEYTHFCLELGLPN